MLLGDSNDRRRLTFRALPAETDEVLAGFGGDHRKAIAALLQDLATLAGDCEGSVSKGFIRSAAPAASRLKRA